MSQTYPPIIYTDSWKIYFTESTNSCQAPPIQSNSMHIYQMNTWVTRYVRRCKIVKMGIELGEHTHRETNKGQSEVQTKNYDSPASKELRKSMDKGPLSLEG